MTLMAAEAGSGAAEAEAADASSSARTTVNRPPKRRATGGRTQQGTQGRARAATTRVASKAGPEGRATTAVVSRAPSRRRAGGAASPARSRNRPQIISGRGSNYKAVILGELLLAVIVVTITPLSRKNKGQVSPFGGQDLIQFAALLAVYLILAIIAGTNDKAARLAAWFGGLILLSIGLAETSALVNTLAIFGGSNAQQPAPGVRDPDTPGTTNTVPNPSQVNPNPVGPPAPQGVTGRDEQQETKPLGSP